MKSAEAWELRGLKNFLRVERGGGLLWVVL